MSTKVRRCMTTVVVFSLLIQAQFAVNGYAALKAQIAFTSTRDGNSEIYVMDSNGQHATRLTMESTNLAPVWSPDGAKIAFTRTKRGIQIWVMDADGGNQTQLTRIGWNHQPAWSRNGNRIAFVTRLRHRGPEIYAMDPDGSNKQRLTQDTEEKGHPSWSPDGRRIAYESLHQGLYQIFVVEADGSGKTERLTHNPPHKKYPAWSPDGDTIAYCSWDVHTPPINLMTADGIHLKQLTELHGGRDTDPDWFSPVGRSVSPTANFVTIWGEIKSEPAGRR